MVNGVWGATEQLWNAAHLEKSCWARIAERASIAQLYARREPDYLEIARVMATETGSLPAAKGEPGMGVRAPLEPML